MSGDDLAKGLFALFAKSIASSKTPIFWGPFFTSKAISGPFLVDFGPRFRPYFRGLENPTIDSAAQKILARYFAHPKQEPLFGTDPVDREVKETRKTGFQ